jgi:hypothetical protein
MANEPQKLTPEQLAEFWLLETTPEDEFREAYIEFKAILREACVLPILCKKNDDEWETKYYRFKETEYTQMLLKKMNDENPTQTIDDVAERLIRNPNTLNFDRSINSKVAGTISWFLRYHKLDFFANVIQNYVSNSVPCKADFSEKHVEELPREEMVLDCYEFQNKELGFADKQSFIAGLLKSFEVEELTKKEVNSLLHDEDLSGNSEEIRFSNRKIRKYISMYAKHNAGILFKSPLRELFGHLQLPVQQIQKKLAQ